MPDNHWRKQLIAMKRPGPNAIDQFSLKANWKSIKMITKENNFQIVTVRLKWPKS